MQTQTHPSKCVIVGGGPAGMMLGYLLARSGVSVTVLEKHPDFNRDFRGDTVHPSTLDVFHELGLLDEFLRLPHQEIRHLGGIIGGQEFAVADMSALPTRCRFVALMPQWDLLDFIARKAKQYPNFDLRMEHEVTELVRTGDRVTGVRARTKSDGDVELEADLVVGCDGRHAVSRQSGQLPVVERGVPIDVLWFRLSRHEGDTDQVLGNVNYGRLLILINRGEYFQAGLVIRKGSFDDLKAQGLDQFKGVLRRMAPYLGDRVNEITDWNQIKLLTVQISRLLRWHEPGLLCIGDAAHAMSPVFGVGINLAIQDAVAAANILTEPLLRGYGLDSALPAVQSRREFPTRAMQGLQALVHRGFEKMVPSDKPLTPPVALRAVLSVPGIKHVTARIVGLGFRREHVAGSSRAKNERIRSAAAFTAGVCVALGAASVMTRRTGQPAA